MAVFDDDIDGKYRADVDTWGQGVGVHPGAADDVTIDSDVVTNADVAGAAGTLLLAAGGTLAGNELLEVNGNIAITGGTLTLALLYLVDDGTIVIPEAQIAPSLTIWTGKVGTTAGDVWVQKFGVQSAAHLTGAHKLRLKPTANDFYNNLGTVDCDELWFQQFNSLSNGAVAYQGGGASGLWMLPNTAQTLTMTGSITAPDTPFVTIYSYGGVKATVDLNGHSLLAPGAALILGAGAQVWSGILTCGSGVVRVASIARKDAANNDNALALDRATLILSGTADGTDIVITGEGAHVHGGVLQDADVTGSVHRFGATADSGNTNVIDCPSPIGPGVALMAA